MSTQISGLSSLLPKTKCKFTWRQLVLTKTDWSSKNSYDLSADLGFEKTLAVLSEDLSFCEKLKVSTLASKQDVTAFDQELFFKEAGYTRYDLIEQISKLSATLPADFLGWCASKKLNLKDFRAFLNDYNTTNDEVFFSKLSDLDPTKNSGLQILELYFDLRAQKKIALEDLMSFKNAELLMTSLTKKRFSAALSKDQLISDELSKMKISSGVKTTLKRSGDKRQIRLELDADSPEQLVTKLEKSLKHIESFKKAWNLSVTT